MMYMPVLRVALILSCEHGQSPYHREGWSVLLSSTFSIVEQVDLLVFVKYFVGVYINV